MYRHGGETVCGEDMSEQEMLQGPQLAAVEAQLHALLRMQAKHALPVDLPRPDFWSICSQLLQTIEMELAEINRLEGFSARAQTLSRRQANLRRAIADLTRHRLNAFVNHAALANLASTPFGDAATAASANLAPVDWQRQDGAERAFHSGVAELIEQYKRNVSWNGLQQGVLGTTVSPPPITPAGNAQLDQFVEDQGGLTGQEPPVIEIQSVNEEWDDPDFDDEDRVSMMEEFPEISESMVTADSEPIESSGISSESHGMMRLRILRDMPEPILDESGEEIELLEGDSFNCAALMAETLIAAGWAEAVSLD
jgi:hypothetical protein